MKNTTLTLLSHPQISEYYEQGHWQDQTLYALARAHALTNPNAFAIQDCARRLTYAELIEAADALAGKLHLDGVRAGQRVGVWMPSRVETAIALLACSRNSYTCCLSLHRDHTVGDIVNLMERSKASAFIAQKDYGADAHRHDIFKAIQGVTSVRSIIALESVQVAAKSAQPLAKTLGPSLESASKDAHNPTPASNDPNRVIYLAYTSGTTGVPKGVMHSDNTLLANARSMARDWHFNNTSVIYTLSPLSHNLGLGALVVALSSGGELVVHDLPKQASLLDRILDIQATFLFGVPTHAIDLLTELRERGINSLGRLQGFRISGASVPQELVANLLSYGVKPQSGYGMTEGCSHHYTLPTDEPRRIIETSGRACAGYEVRIFSTDNPELELPIGEIGQIGARGASLMLGYFNDQLATEEAFNQSGWFMTGDLGFLDDQGYIVITGRKKDLIIRGGHNIYPSRIENLALEHPAVLRAAVLPVPDARLVEKVCLAIMTRAGLVLEAEEMLEHLDRAGLSRFDMPEYYLELQEIPLTASGKIYKRDLVESIKSGELVPKPVRFKSKDQVSA
jgi:acyl-CoA synthetase